MRFENIGNMTIAEIDRLIDLLAEKKRSGFFRAFWRTAEEAAQHFDLSREDAGRITALALRTLRSPACSGGLRVLLSQL